MNNKYKDITGQRFNRLIAVKPLYTKKGRGMFWGIYVYLW